MRGNNLRRERKGDNAVVQSRNQYDTVSISRTIALECGVCAAFVFEDVSRWIRSNAERGKNIHDGRAWMYDKIEQITADVGLFSMKTVQRALTILVKNGYLIKGNYNQKGYDRTTWYALGNRCFSQNDLIKTKCPNGCGQNCQMPHLDKMTSPIPIDNNKCLNSTNTIHKGSGGEKGAGVVCSGDYPRENIKKVMKIKKLEWPEFKEFLAFVQEMNKSYMFDDETIEKAVAKWRMTNMSKSRISKIGNWKGWILGFMVNMEQKGTGEILANPNYLKKI